MLHRGPCLRGADNTTLATQTGIALPPSPTRNPPRCNPQALTLPSHMPDPIRSDPTQLRVRARLIQSPLTCFCGVKSQARRHCCDQASKSIATCLRSSPDQTQQHFFARQVSKHSNICGQMSKAQQHLFFLRCSGCKKQQSISNSNSNSSHHSSHRPPP